MGRLEARGELRKPRGRCIDQQRFQPFVQPGEDQQSDHQKQDAEHYLSALPRAQKPVAPAHHDFARDKSQQEERKRRPDAERDHHQRNLTEILTLRGKNGGSSEGWSDAWRSEEHTSELQSLMRISYAVFCLKKKTKH